MEGLLKIESRLPAPHIWEASPVHATLHSDEERDWPEFDEETMEFPQKHYRDNVSEASQGGTGGQRTCLPYSTPAKG